MKKIILCSLVLAAVCFSAFAQDDQNGIFIESDGGSTIIVSDSGTTIVVGGNDSSYIPPEITPSTTANHDASYFVKDVPNPKKEYNGYVSDPDHYLKPETISALNSMLASLESKTTDQVAVVVVNSISDQEPKSFAHSLFNRWGIGIRGKDNGLLILMVMDQRRVEFETGYGMEEMLPDAICKRIQLNYMVPEFKAGDYDKGLLEGVRATYDILSNPENSQIAASLKEEMAKEDQEERLSFIAFFVISYALLLIFIYIKKHKDEDFRDLMYGHGRDYYNAMSRLRWILLYIGIPLLYTLYMYSFYTGDTFKGSFILGCYLIAMFFLLEKRIRLNKSLKKTQSPTDHYSNYKAYRDSHAWWWLAALAFPVVFILYLLIMQAKKKALRNQPRNCTSCQHALVKLNEKEDDQHLKKTQVLEEELNSIDYDVWLCNSCGAKEVYAFANTFSKYSKCGRCQVTSSYLFSDRTIESPTYTSTGTGCKTYKCKNCSYENEVTYTIAMKTESSSSSSGGSSGGGGSFGGGSSGGGGSGSSW